MCDSMSAGPRCIQVDVSTEHLAKKNVIRMECRRRSCWSGYLYVCSRSGKNDCGRARRSRTSAQTAPGCDHWLLKTFQGARIHLPMTRVFAILFLTPNEAQVRVLPERWAGRSCDWAHCVRRKVRQRPVHARPLCAAFSSRTVGPLAVQRGGVMPCFAKTAREALETG